MFNEGDKEDIPKNQKSKRNFSIGKIYMEIWKIRWVLFLFISFSVIYSSISYLRYLSFSENVYDLGVNASLAYNVIYGQTFLGQVISGGVATNKLIYIPIGLVYALFPKEYFLLFIQDFFLSFSGVLIYLIAREVLKSKKFALLISLIFYLYYPLSGVFWFDFHYMAFFPTFFLLGVYYYIRRDTSKWLIFLSLASITDLMSPVIVFLFLAIMVMQRRISSGKFNIMKYELSESIFAIIIFILPSIYYLKFYPSHYIGINLNPGIYGNVWFKAEFFVRIMLPFLFIPLLGIEFLILLLPYGLLLFTNSYLPYESQMFFQYPSLYVSTLFIAFIFGLRRFIKISGKRFNIRKLLVIILILNIILFYLFTPIGNLIPAQQNDHPQEEYVVGSSTILYSTYEKIIPTKADGYLMSFINNIPHGSSVLIAGNLPELEQGYMPVCLNSNFNTTIPDYIITDPYSYFFTSPVAIGIHVNNSPIIKINYLLNNFNYKLTYFYKGVALYQLNSVLSPVIYGYLNENSSSVIQKDKGISYYNVGLIAPGCYNLTLNGLSGKNNLSLLSLNKEISVIGKGNDFIKIRSNSYFRNIKIYLSLDSITVIKQELELKQYSANSR
jgi:uncharacterized membrane protein